MPVRKKKGRKATPKKQSAYKMPPPFPAGEVIHDPSGKKWRIGPSIGVGGFGEIYSACDHDNSLADGTVYPYVIKIEPYENGPLFVEMHFYLRNSDKKDITDFMASRWLSSLGMPTFHCTGEHIFKEESFRYIVLDRYGKDVKKIFQEARAFKAPTAFQLGLQMLDVLEYIHSRGYVHADLKGANMLLGLKEGTENQVYLVDYGLATRLSEEPFDPDPRCAHNGTIEYTSRDAHLGEPTMRGDLEILAYNLLHWIAGSLPWGPHTEKPKKVHTLKKDLMNNPRDRIEEDYPDVPDALIQFFEYISTLQPKDHPDYNKCKQIFENYLNSEGKSRSTQLDFTPSEIANRIVVEENKKSVKSNSAADKESSDCKTSIKSNSIKAETNNVSNELLSADSTTSKINNNSKKAKSANPTNKNGGKKASIKAENNHKKAPIATTNYISDDDLSDDDKPLKPSSTPAKGRRGRKRKSDKVEIETKPDRSKKAKEPENLLLIDNPMVRRLRNWGKRNELIKALK